MWWGRTQSENNARRRGKHSECIETVRTKAKKGKKKLWKCLARHRENEPGRQYIQHACVSRASTLLFALNKLVGGRWSDSNDSLVAFTRDSSSRRSSNEKSLTFYASTVVLAAKLPTINGTHTHTHTESWRCALCATVYCFILFSIQSCFFLRARCVCGSCLSCTPWWTEYTNMHKHTHARTRENIFHQNVQYW